MATGSRSWDQELFRVVNQIDQVHDREALSRMYLDWIASLGEVRRCTACVDNLADHFLKNFDLSWTQDSTWFSVQLQQQFSYLIANRHQGINRFVAPDYAGHFKMTNEPTYPPSEWTNVNVRLLLLFRYWNVVEYYYPYKYLMDKSWNNVLLDMIPRFLKIESETDFHLLLRELVVSLDDSHAVLETDKISSYFGEYSLPIRYKIIDQKMIVTRVWNDSLARIDDLRVGDAILELDGRSVQALLNEAHRYINGSNEATKAYYSFVSLPRGSTSQVKIRFERDGKQTVKVVNRYKRSNAKISVPPVLKWKRIDSNIGYVNLAELETTDVRAMFKELWNTRGLVFDLRGYPDFTLDRLADYLLSEPKEYIQFIKPDYNFPGKFLWRKPVSCGRRNKQPYPGKVVIMVNEQTQSLAEATAMGLSMVPGALVVGSQTSGADGDVSEFTFFEGVSSFITGLGAFYPDKTETQRIGVRVDIRVEPTIDGIRRGEDEVLKKAVELIGK